METELHWVVEIFTRELQRLRARGDRLGSYSEDSLTLSVALNGEKPTIKLSYARGYGNTVLAANLGTLMDEVYRREGFDDREAGKVQVIADALVSLPAPDPVPDPVSDDEIPF